MKRPEAPSLKLVLVAGVGLLLSACVVAPAPSAYYAPGYYEPGYYYAPGPAVQFDYYGGRYGRHRW